MDLRKLELKILNQIEIHIQIEMIKIDNIHQSIDKIYFFDSRNFISKTPQTSSTYDQISESIWEYFKNNAQTYECYKKKQDFRDALHAMFDGIFPCKFSIVNKK